MRVRGLLPILISFLMLSGCFGPEKIPEDEYDQVQTDIYVYSGESMLQKIDSCPYFSDYNTVTSQTYYPATHIRPSSGLNDNNQYEIYEPGSVEGKFVIAYLDLREIYENGANEIYYHPWLQFFESEGAAGVIFSEVADFEEELNSCDDIVYYYGDSEGTQFTSSSKLSIPVIQISADDMRDLEKIAVTGIVIGADGFELGDIDELIQASKDDDVGLPNTKISEWVSDYVDCSANNEGAIVITTKIDGNQDGTYQGSEITQDIECRTSSPYSNGVVSIQTETMVRATSSDVCASLEEYWKVQTIEYADGTTETQQDEPKCEGTSSTDIENVVVGMFCDDSEDMNEDELARVSVIDCIAPSYESELMQIIPQIKVDSLTSSQMPQCENGGLLIQVWADHDGNGQWSQAETQSSQRLCHGTDGTDGADGIDGLDAYELLMDTTEAGSEMCDSDVGGTEVFIGRDVNQNGVLDDSEIEHSYATCNGEDGSDGQDGTSSIVNITSYSSPSCNGVYVRLANGFDYDGDDTLSTDETLGARYICLPSQQTNTEATFVKETIEPNSVCQNGGVHSYIWIDSNGDGDVQDGDNVSEIFMESFDCAEDEVVVECTDSDGDCISDYEDADDGNDRETGGDSDFDGVPDEDEHPNCIGEDNREDSDFDGIPDCEDDDF
jgi:hypothetical protein